MPSSDGFLAGVREGIPVWFAAAPVGLVFGAVAAQQGLSVADATFMGATVFAGASQMVAVDLYGNDVPLWLIVLSVFAVNFRHVLYSAAIASTVHAFRPVARWPAFHLLIDPQYALAEKRVEERRPVGPAWWFGLGLPIYGLWVLECALGAAFGRLIESPASFGLDMILPIYFLALVMGFRARANWWPVIAASGLTALAVYHLPAIGPPWHVSLGALAGILTAALLPPRERRPAEGARADELPSVGMPAAETAR